MRRFAIILILFISALLLYEIAYEAGKADMKIEIYEQMLENNEKSGEEAPTDSSDIFTVRFRG